MSMSMTELQRALRALRLSGMIATLEARAMQVQSHQMNFLEAFSWLVRLTWGGRKKFPLPLLC